MYVTSEIVCVNSNIRLVFSYKIKKNCLVHIFTQTKIMQVLVSVGVITIFYEVYKERSISRWSLYSGYCSGDSRSKQCADLCPVHSAWVAHCSILLWVPLGLQRFQRIPLAASITWSLSPYCLLEHVYSFPHLLLYCTALPRLFTVLSVLFVF